MMIFTRDNKWSQEPIRPADVSILRSVGEEDGLGHGLVAGTAGAVGAARAALMKA